MTRSALDQLRDANPIPTPLPAPPVDPILNRLAEIPAPHPGSPPLPGRTRRLLARPAAWAVPIAGVLITLAVVGAAWGLLGTGARPPRPSSASSQTSPARTSSGPTLSAGQYAFAVGGDANAPGGQVLWHADQVLRQRCMRQRGFRYIAVPISPRSALPMATGFPSTFYPQPLPGAYPESALLALRERDGFGIAASIATQGHDPDPNDQYLKTLSPAQQRRWRTAWMGRNGCYGWAEVHLFGSRQAADLEQLLPTEIYDRLNTAVYAPDGSISSANRVTQHAAAAWSRCMRTATGRAWTDENALVSWLTSTPRSSARPEINLAVADARCAYSTGQAQAFAAAFRQAASRLPSAIAAQLGFLLAHRRGWITKADRIVASAGG